MVIDTRGLVHQDGDAGKALTGALRVIAVHGASVDSTACYTGTSRRQVGLLSIQRIARCKVRQEARVGDRNW